MIVKILGSLDLAVGILFWVYGIFHVEFLGGIVLILALFLLVKGLVFVASLDVASVMDIIFAILILIGLVVALPKVIVIIIAILILQKGIFSMLN
ncbi:MAG: hypothetical protein ABIH37_02135 [archaeon]